MHNHATLNFDNLLFQVAERTFGEPAFFLVELEEISQAKNHEPSHWGYCARVEFTGPFNGELHVAISENMLPPLASNMLGIDECEDLPTGVKMEDALKELLNVTCGNLLPLIGGDQVVFHIGAPELLPPPAPPVPEKYVPVGHVRMSLDAGAAYFALFLDPSAGDKLTPTIPSKE